MAMDWCKRHGLEAIFEPSKPSEADGMLSGGVAIAVRQQLGLVAYDNGALVAPYRAVAASVNVLVRIRLGLCPGTWTWRIA